MGTSVYLLFQTPSTRSFNQYFQLILNTIKSFVLRLLTVNISVHYAFWYFFLFFYILKYLCQDLFYFLYIKSLHLT